MTARKLETIQPIVRTEAYGAGRVLHVIKSVPAQIEQIPATRYYGSKRRFLGWLYSKLRGYEFETVLDAFGGTACVSQMFRAMGKKVTYHDAFHFNVDVATTLLASDVALSKRNLGERLANVKPSEGVISRQFKGIFYTEDENAWLDGFMLEVSKLSRSENKTSLLLYLLYQACLKKRPFNLFHRSNLGLRTNRNIERSFGNFVTWETPFSDHMMNAYNELPTSRIETAPNSTILPAQNASDIDSGYDLVYIDPPYAHPKNQSNPDGYWRKYHFLEGLSSYDSWENKIDPTSRIRLSKAPEHFTVWSSRTTLKDSLFDLIQHHRSSIVVLSYMAGAYPSESEIKEYFESLFSEVSLHSIKHTYALSKSKKRELLYIGIPT